MGVYVIRLFFVIMSTLLGFSLLPDKRVAGIAIGFLGSSLVVLIEILLGRIPFKKMLLGVSGLIIGLLTAILIANFVLIIPIIDLQAEYYIRFFLYFVFSYMGVMVGLRGVEEMGFVLPFLKSSNDQERLLVVDTSILIDGRVYDVIKSGFLEYKLVVPKFILKEMHELSDCSGDMKRQRGRRGLDVLKKLQNDSSISLTVYDVDYPDVEAVDSKLVKLAAQLRASILTNDYNLSKVAEVQSIKVLNLNSLATMMRPRLMSGEEISLKIVKEGKEAGQGVGYLEDGTMIVVEKAAKFNGKVKTVIIDSAIQTNTGRIIFGKLK